jgi:putative ABC transport system permease protein
VILRGLWYLLAALARLVPPGARARWREEWFSELEAIAQRRGHAVALRVAAGAAADAIGMRHLAAARTGAAATLTRGFMPTWFTWLDVRLAVRMLIRYPGLAATGVIGMAVGIAIAAGAFSILSAFMTPALPFDEGDRIVAIQHFDANRNNQRRPWVHDFAGWRGTLASVEDVGAFRQVNRNLIAPGAATETVRVAEISAAAFKVTRVGALMGRPLLDADEQPGAPAVVVIGHGLWRSRFNGDPHVIGRSMQLGDTDHAIVGVMPEGFAFPVQHDLWVPLRLDVTRYARGTGPEVLVFGRLADGATFESAQAELTTVGDLTAAEFPSTHQRIRPRVVPYTYPFFDIDSAGTLWIGRLVQVLLALLLAVVSVNVAILVYARTARRQGEIAVRTALGASRARIVGQLFIEALLLAAVAAVVGLFATAVGLRYLNDAMAQGYGALPFWWNFRLSPAAMWYVVGLTLLAAAIVGIAPALKATGRRVQHDLQRISAGGGAGMRLGRTWTALIVIQVAFAVALLPAAVHQAWEAVRASQADPGFAAREFVAATVTRDPGSSVRDAQQSAVLAGQSVEQLRQRLASDAAVAEVTYASAWPGAEAAMVIEIDGVTAPAGPVDYNVREGSRTGHLAWMNTVDVGFFSTFDIPLLAGRGLTAADAAADATAIVVSREFARQLLGDTGVLGRRIRYVGRSGDAPSGLVPLERWYEIVGVVADFPAPATGGWLSGPKLFHAGRVEAIQPATLLLRMRGGPAADFGPRLRDLAAAVDPNLQFRTLSPLDALFRQDQDLLRIVAAVLAALTAAVLLLSSAGIYAMMSFIVAQRRKEIGIRAALGADPRRILHSIFSRALAQLAAGALLGGLTALALELATEGAMMNGNAATVLPVVIVVMTAIGLAAALGPARRGLSIPPTEALREQ